MLVTFGASTSCVLALTTIVGFASAQTISTDVPWKARKFACAPTTLYDGETLNITMSVPHPQELGVWKPSNDFVFLHQCVENRPMDECKEFTQVAAVKLRTGSIEVPIYGYAEKKEIRLFSSKGWYTFLLSANLQTENNARTINRCRVYFAGAKPH